MRIAARLLASLAEPCRIAARTAAAALRLLAILLLASGATGKALAEGDLDCDAALPDRDENLRTWHNPGLAAISDHEICFEGYVSNFDGIDDDDGDGEPDILAVPHFVVHRVEGAEHAPESRERPRLWFTVASLMMDDIAPTDQSYRYSVRPSDWYERGHLAQKYLLERISADAGKYSHNVVNAAPQRGRFNKSVWLDLECRTGAWANHYGRVWVITGPVFLHLTPATWLGEAGRKERRHGRDASAVDVLPVAIPDALFKIVVREDEGELITLAFIMPQADESYLERSSDLSPWLTSVARIEELTRQTFFPDRDVAGRDSAATELWPQRADWFDSGCRRFARDLP